MERFVDQQPRFLPRDHCGARSLPWDGREAMREELSFLPRRRDQKSRHLRNTLYAAGRYFLLRCAPLPNASRNLLRTCATNIRDLYRCINMLPQFQIDKDPGYLAIATALSKFREAMRRAARPPPPLPGICCALARQISGIFTDAIRSKSRNMLVNMPKIFSILKFNGVGLAN